MNITIDKEGYALTIYYGGVYEEDEIEYEFTLIVNNEENSQSYFIDINWLSEIPLNKEQIEKEIETQWLEN